MYTVSGYGIRCIARKTVQSIQITFGRIPHPELELRSVDRTSLDNFSPKDDSYASAMQ